MIIIKKFGRDFVAEIEIESSEKVDFLIKIFEQNFVHARHVETERMSFTNLFALTVAGVLSLIVNSQKEITNFIPVIMFLILFSIIGSFFILKLNLEFHNNKSHVIKIAKKFDFTEYLARPIGHMKKTKEFNTKLPSVSVLFLIFYILTMAGLCGITIFIFCKDYLITIISSLIIFLLAIIPLYNYQDKLMDQIDNSV